MDRSLSQEVSDDADRADPGRVRGGPRSDRSPGHRWLWFLGIASLVPCVGAVLVLLASSLYFTSWKRSNPQRAVLLDLLSLGAFLVSVLLGVLVSIVMVAPISPSLGQLRRIDTLDLWYTPQITNPELDRLERFLRQNFVSENHTTVQIDRQDGTYLFRFVIKKGLDQDPEVIQEMRHLASEMSRDVFQGRGVDFHLCDSHMQTIRVVVPF
jgi:hypothetical protein